VPGHLIDRVVRRGRERPTYELVLKPDRQVATLGTSSKLLNRHEVKARLLDATHHAMRTPKDDPWDRVVELIVRAAEYSDEPDADWRQRLREYLADRLTRDRNEAAKRSEPFEDNASRPPREVRPVPAQEPGARSHPRGCARRATRTRLRERRRVVDQGRRPSRPDDLLARAGGLGPVSATGANSHRPKCKSRGCTLLHLLQHLARPVAEPELRVRSATPGANTCNRPSTDTIPDLQHLRV
jgi:hypothetical protein